MEVTILSPPTFKLSPYGTVGWSGDIPFNICPTISIFFFMPTLTCMVLFGSYSTTIPNPKSNLATSLFYVPLLSGNRV